MTTQFQQRLHAGTLFESDLHNWLQTRRGIVAVAKNGTEHTHPAFVDMLRDNHNPAAKFVRYAPDGVFLKDNTVVHYDAKVAYSIEKDAYLNYMLYPQMGCPLLLFVKNKARGKVFFQHIEKLGLEPPTSRWPVDADGWYSPREDPEFIRRKMNGEYKHMSGTPYLYIDFGSMIEVHCFGESP